MKFKLLIMGKEIQEAESIRLTVAASVDKTFIASEITEAVDIIETESIHAIICVNSEALDLCLLALDKTKSLIPLIVLGQFQELVEVDYQSVIFLTSKRADKVIEIIESFKKSFLNTSIS